MFGLFDSDVKRARRLRTEFEDLRQLYLSKFTEYEKHHFEAAIWTYRDHFDARAALCKAERAKWRVFAKELRAEVKSAFWAYARSGSGLAHAGTSGASGLGLYAILAEAKSLACDEAVILAADIERFWVELELGDA